MLGSHRRPFSGQVSLVRSALCGLRVGLIVFPGYELNRLLDVDIREVNAQHLASVGPQADDELHPADTVDNKETTVVASDREPNRPAQVNGRCRPLACRTRCSPPARKRSAGEPIGCQTPTCASMAMPGPEQGRGHQFGTPRGVLPPPG